MATYSRNQTAEQTQEKSPVASKDLSTVIIESFDSVKEQMEENKNDNEDNKDSELSLLLKQNIKQQDDMLKLLIDKNKDGSKVGEVSTKSKGLESLLIQKNKQADVETDKTKSKTDKNDAMQGLLETKQEKDSNKSKDKEKEGKVQSYQSKHITKITSIDKGITTIAGALAKAALVVFTLSQISVLLKAGWAWLQNYLPIKMEKTIADIKSYLVTIPETIKLNLEKVLTRVKILGSPVFSSGLSDEEKKEKNQIEKDKDVKVYNQLQKNIDNKEKQKQDMIRVAAQRVGMDTTNMDLNDPVVRQKIQFENFRMQEDLFTSGKINERNYRRAIASLERNFSEWDKIDAFINEAKAGQQELLLSESTKQKIARYNELKDIESQGPINYDEKLAELNAKRESLSNQYFWEAGIKDYQNGQHWTATQTKMRAAIMGIDTRDKDAIDMFKQNVAQAAGEDKFTARGQGGEVWGDKYLRNEFADWTRAWEQLGRNLGKNFGLKVEQLPPRNAERNPTSCR